MQVKNKPTMMKMTTRRRTAGPCLRVMSTTLLLAGLVSAGGAGAAIPDVTATYTVTTQAPTCTVTVNGGISTLTLPGVTVADLTAQTTPITTKGSAFQVKLSNCTGTPTLNTRPNLLLWGSADSTGGSTMFKNTDGTTGKAGGVGFALTNNSTGQGTALTVKTTKTDALAFPVTLDPVTGAGVVDFFAMPMRGGYAASAVTGGTMKTELNFDMDYR
jgi:type 1 fimbria pilin